MYDALLSIIPSFLEPIFPFLIFLFGLATLVKCADLFVDYAEELGFKLKIPDFIIGITVVGIGTSLPELATSLSAIYQSTPDEDITGMISANVIGSNIANILLGVGIASFFKVIRVNRELQDNDLPFLFGSTAIAILFLLDGVLTRGEGLVLTSMFAVFIAFSIMSGSQKDELKEEKKRIGKGHSLPLLLLYIVFSGIGIALSSEFTIRGLTEAAPIIGIEKDVASMVLLAIGTSFPEIFVSIVAVRKGKSSMAIGNILGSNIGNILGILGLSALITDITVSEKSIYVGLPFLAVASFFFIISTMDNRVRLWEGIMTVAIFVAFLGKLFEVF